jgi:hypothetical protein
MQDDGEMVVAKTIKIEGKISIRNLEDEGETDVIYVSDNPNDPLGERLVDAGVSHKRISVRYWTATEKASADDIKAEFIKKMLGYADARFGPHYSDITGYLWTDNHLNVGGHNLLAELASFAGRWLVLEIDIEDVPGTRQLRASRSLRMLANKLLRLADVTEFVPYDMSLNVKFTDRSANKGEATWKLAQDGKLYAQGSGGRAVLDIVFKDND